MANSALFYGLSLLTQSFLVPWWTSSRKVHRNCLVVISPSIKSSKQSHGIVAFLTVLAFPPPELTLSSHCRSVLSKGHVGGHCRPSISFFETFLQDGRLNNVAGKPSWRPLGSGRMVKWHVPKSKYESASGWLLIIVGRPLISDIVKRQ